VQLADYPAIEEVLDNPSDSYSELWFLKVSESSCQLST